MLYLGLVLTVLAACSVTQEINTSVELDWEHVMVDLGKDFIFSSATSAYQAEGAWNTSGKGESIWDRLTHTRPDYIKDRTNGDIATDFYHKYSQDVTTMKDIGFVMHRFSLSWSRLFPTGYVSDGANQDGVRFYNELIDLLLANNIQPMVTVYHWDLPQPLEDVGGWLAPNISSIFAEYAKEVFSLFGDRVHWWVTLNEPRSTAGGYGSTTAAPALDLHGTGEYESAHNLLLAHAKAYRIYDQEFRPTQGGKVSMVMSGLFNIPRQASDPQDVEAAERANIFSYGWFLDPIVFGDYPALMKTAVAENSRLEGRPHSRLPSFSSEQIQLLRGTYDYIGLNYYTSYVVQPGLTGPEPSWNRDRAVIQSAVPGSPTTACDWQQVVPAGLRTYLTWISDRYSRPELFITESGYCSHQQLDDSQRIAFYKDHLRSMLAGMVAGDYTVRGFTAWSFMDDFEWKNGYTIRFGLMQVDFDSPERTRTWKQSAKFFKKFLNQFYGNNSKSLS